MIGGWRQVLQRAGWVELFAKPIIFATKIDGYRFAPPILRAWFNRVILTARRSS
jgi:hypothetical protein